MSVYSIKGKGWRYDFTLAGQRYTEAWFKTMRKAQAAEAKKRKGITYLTSQPPPHFSDLLRTRIDGSGGLALAKILSAISSAVASIFGTDLEGLPSLDSTLTSFFGFIDSSLCLKTSATYLYPFGRVLS